MSVRILHGDSRELLKGLADCSIDSCVCDPPYALVSIGKRFGKPGAAPAKSEGASGVYARASAGFMGQQWDTGETAFAVEFWAEVYRVLKPGAHVVAFSGTRTYHRMACAVEDAGFEIRDQLGWAFGSGFPKSHNQSGEWQGWGSALKPAWEPICLARKPLIGTIAANLAEHRCGALNIDACRIDGEYFTRDRETTGGSSMFGLGAGGGAFVPAAGRWPANLLHDGSDEVLAAFPEADGGRPVNTRKAGKFGGVYADFKGRDEGFPGYEDAGSAARFFYSAKAGPYDRFASKHPTVKPVDLMRWLVRLVTPPKVVDWVCETCNNPPHDDDKLQDLQQAAKPAEADGILLFGVQGRGADEAAAAVQNVRGASQSTDAGVLLTNLPSGGGARRGEDADATSMRVVRDGVQAEEKRGTTLLQPGLRLGGVGVSEAQTADADGSRLLAGLSARSSDGFEDRLRDGAPPDHGRVDRQVAQAQRGRPPSKRGQGRQSARELAADGQAGARSDTEVAQEPGAQLSPLPGANSAQQLCPHCRGPLTRRERPGVVLDPFAGTGTTGAAAMIEGFDCILMEREAEYVADIKRRIAWMKGDGPLTEQALARDAASTPEDLPLFATQDTAQPASQPASQPADASCTASSPETPDRAGRDDEVVRA